MARRTPPPPIADALAAGVAANAGHPSLELLWGSPGTMHAALTMHEWTGEARWAELFRADADALWRAFLPADEAPCRLWTQDLWGRKEKMTGAGHGFAGNASALIRGRALLPAAAWAQWADAIIETAHATALREGPLANWVPEVPPAHTPPKIARAVVSRRAGDGDQPGRPSRSAPRRTAGRGGRIDVGRGSAGERRGAVPRDGRQWLCVVEAVQAQRRPALAGSRARVRDARDGAMRPHGRGTWPAPPFAVDRRRRRCLLRRGVASSATTRCPTSIHPLSAARSGVRAATACLRRDWGNGAQRACGCRAYGRVRSMPAVRLG